MAHRVDYRSRPEEEHLLTQMSPLLACSRVLRCGSDAVTRIQRKVSRWCSSKKTTLSAHCAVAASDRILHEDVCPCYRARWQQLAARG